MTEKEILNRIYPSVVTYAEGEDDRIWEKMIKDVKRLKLKQISLFLTGAGNRDKKKIIELLKDTSVKEIPHVHARHDMTEEIYDLLVENFKTKVFTLHYQYIDTVKNSKHKKKIFIENNYGRHRIQNINSIKKVGGACIDLSHFAEFRDHRPREHNITLEVVKRYKVGCNHLSGVKKNGISWHKVDNISELDYVTEIPKKYFSKYINIELVNSIPQQLKFKKYIAKKLYKAWQTKS